MCISIELNAKKSEILNGMVDFVMKDFIQSLHRTKNNSSALLKSPRGISNSTLSYLDSNSYLKDLTKTNLQESNICVLNNIGD